MSLGQMARSSRFSYSYCAGQVRRFDPDRYLTTLFAPQDRREGLHALYAFNLEIARIPEVVTEPLIGAIRLQWWRETIADVYAGTPQRHAVVESLAKAVTECGLTRSYFDRLLEARSFDQDRHQPANLAELKTYAEATSVSLVHLALEILGVAASAAVDQAASGVGLSWALVGLLRAVPFHGRAGRLYLPADLLEANRVAARDIQLGKASDRLAGVAQTLAGEARAALGRARAVKAAIPRHALPALLLGALADSHLRVLERAGHNLFDPRVQRPALFHEAGLWLRARKGDY